MDIVTQTAAPAGIYHLSAEGDYQPVTDTLAGEFPDRVNDLPAFYYWKDAIAVGSYVHPAGRFSLDITRDRLDGFVQNFNRMKDAGVGIPILMDHTATASSTLGWIVDVKRDGDRFLELHQFLGEDARDIGLRNKVSLGIDPAFVDGQGNQYGEAIVHSAVTPTPVVAGQGEFVPLGGVGVSPTQNLDSARIELTLKAPLSTLLPAEAGSPVTDKPVVNLDLQNALRQVVEMKRDLALSRGGVNPAVAAELFNLLVGSGNLLTLSRSSNGSPIAMAVFDALARNTPIELGEGTGLQVLSRVVPGDEDNDLRARMIALASGKS